MTFGHIDLVERGLAIFDEIVIVIAHSVKKAPLFTTEERVQLVRESFSNNPRVKIDVDDGLLVDYARKHHIKVIIRGLRALSDFEYEFQMATMNRRLYPEIQSIFLMSSDRFFFVNSTLVKEVFSHGGDISELVPPHTIRKLGEKLCSN